MFKVLTEIFQSTECPSCRPTETDLPSFDNENALTFPQGDDSPHPPNFLPQISYIQSHK